MTAGAPPDPGLVPIRRALVSVGDHRGLFDVACALDVRGVTLVSAHGAWIALGNEGLLTTALAEQVRPLLDRRVETLFAEVHAAIAARGGDPRAELAAIGVEPFELVICNPRRFEIPAQRPDGTLAMAMADVDSDRVTLIQAAARNWAEVAVVVDPDDYQPLLDELDAHDGALTAVTRLRLAAKAFVACAAHDATVASYLADLADDAGRTPSLVIARPRLGTLVTGPWRRAVLAVDGGALYRDPPGPLGIVDDERATVAEARRIGGRALAAAAVRDLARALALVRELGPSAAVIARDDEPAVACDQGHPVVTLLHSLAWAAEDEALAGAALALDGALTPKLSARLTASELSAVLVLAVPEEVLAGWPSDGPSLLVATGSWHGTPATSLGLAPLAWRSIAGGLLIEEVDVAPIGHAANVSARAPTADELRDLELAARVVRHVRAHGLVVTGASSTIAIVGGQPDLQSAIAAARVRYDDLLANGVAATSTAIDDPADLDTLAAAGIRAVYQPGGSPRDQDVMAAADRHGLAMVVTGLEHLRR